MAYGSTPKKKKLDKEFGRSAGASAIEKAKQGIKAKKGTPKGKKITAKASPKKKGWYLGKYAGKAISAVKGGLKKQKDRQKAAKLKTKEEQYKSGQESKSPRTRLATQAGYKAHKSKDKFGVPGGKVGPAKKPSGYKEKPKNSKFGAAFKSNCAGKGAGDTFSWNGKKYTCAKK